MSEPSVDEDCLAQSDVGGFGQLQIAMRKTQWQRAKLQAVIVAKGAEVFQRSKGLAGEAMKGNVRLTLILPVDAKKLSHQLRT